MQFRPSRRVILTYTRHKRGIGKFLIVLPPAYRVSLQQGSIPQNLRQDSKAIKNSHVVRSKLDTGSYLGDGLCSFEDNRDMASTFDAWRSDELFARQPFFYSR